MTVRTLYLMRHAKAVDLNPGGRDVDRPLAPRGHDQAAVAGRWLSARPVPVQVTLCSPSVRTRETYADLQLTGSVREAPVVWEGGPGDIAAEVATVDDTVTSLLVVGHAPGIPALADLLTDRTRTEPDLLTELDRHFPTATIAQLELTGSWSELGSGRLTALQLTH